MTPPPRYSRNAAGTGFHNRLPAAFEVFYIHSSKLNVDGSSPFARFLANPSARDRSWNTWCSGGGSFHWFASVQHGLVREVSLYAFRSSG